MAKFVFEGGHGGFGVTPGKRTPAGEYEWDFNNINARAFEVEMVQYENVQLLRTDDPTGRTDVPLADRVAKANNFGADAFISFHHNAADGVWGTHGGTETYVCGFGGVAHEIAKAVHPGIVGAYQLRDRGIKEAAFYVLKNTNMPAILIEGGFMDSTIDIVRMRNDAVLQNAGRAAAQKLAAYFKLTRKSTSPATADPVEPTSVQILTGGLLPENAKLFTEFCISQDWWAEIKIRKDVNPRGLTGGLDVTNRKECEDFLNAKNWGYTVYPKGEVPTI